ncbi:MAG: hypothetical protein WBO46_03015 [Caldilineaceae bacterium]
MLMESVTLELPVELMRSARLVADKTGTHVERVIQSSLAHALPPLDDLPAHEAAELAALALLDDAQLWEIGRKQLSGPVQMEFTRLLDEQSAGDLTSADAAILDRLLDEYGAALVRSSHAYLLLARRGYNVWLVGIRPNK